MATWPSVSINTDKDFSMCFACGQNNPIGLKLSFEWDGKTTRTEFTPDKLHQGWSGIIHGGIMTCILDEAMSWASLFEGMSCITAKMHVRFKRPTSIDESLIITSSITKKTRRLVEAKATISLKDGTPVAESTATQFVLNHKKKDAGNKEDNPKAMARNKTTAVLWDMDGVIADTACYHLSAWQKVFHKRGVNFTEDDFKHNFGQRNDTIIRNTVGKEVSQNEIDIIANEKEKYFRQRVRQNLKPLPGVIKLISSLRERGVKMALVSSAPMENIQLITKGLGIAECFQAIVYGKEVSEGKPSPQGFLLAAWKLGVNPENCIVIEDAIAGVTAAKRAGMRCIAITNTHPKTSLTEADLLIDTLETITVNDLEVLFNSQRKLEE